MKDNKITALYCRISREDELTEVSSSIETQKAYLKRYANQNKYDNIRYYIDDGHSGANFERPGFIALKNDIENDIVETVITKDLSRLGRDYLTTGYYIEHYFPLHNVRYIAINDQVDTNKNDNDFAPFRNIMNEWYARDISQKIRSAYKTKALNGEFTGPYAPYGYDKDPKDKHKLVINHKQSEIVKRIYQLYLDGNSVYRISRILKQDKVLTPRAELHRIQGVYDSEFIKKYPYDWATQSILHILGNEEYVGKIICNRHQTSSFKSKKLKQNPITDWIVSTNRHEPIIDKNQFDSVRQLMLKKKKTTQTYHENIFKGKLRCHECGKTFSLAFRPDRGGHRSLACSTYRCDTSRCTSHYITYDYLRDYLTEKINDFIVTCQTNKTKFVKQIKNQKSLDKRIIEYEQTIIKSSDRLNEVDELTKKLFEKYVNDKISEDKFYELDISYDSEKIRLVKLISDTESNITDSKKEVNDIDAFYELIRQYDKITDLQREHINSLVDKVVIHEKKNKLNNRIIDVYFVLIGMI